jgi:hypothetical protein
MVALECLWVLSFNPPKLPKQATNSSSLMADDLSSWRTSRYGRRGGAEELQRMQTRCRGGRECLGGGKIGEQWRIGMMGFLSHIVQSNASLDSPFRIGAFEEVRITVVLRGSTGRGI